MGKLHCTGLYIHAVVRPQEDYRSALEASALVAQFCGNVVEQCHVVIAVAGRSMAQALATTS